MLIDSCILIDVSRNKSAALDFIARVEIVPSISALTVMEVRMGVRTKVEQALFDSIFSKWNIIAVDRGVAEQAAIFLRLYKPSHGTDTVDAIIAATAHVHKVELATLNLKHFPMFPALVRPY